MSNPIQYQWRITKYNPAYRNDNGGYMKDEWISSSDIGKNIGGETLSLEDYLKVEAAYVATIMKFIEANQIDVVRILTVSSSCSDKKSVLYDKEIETLSLKADCEVPVAQVPLLAKMTLRECIHCHFITKDFFVHFGYDYYMFIGSNSYVEEPIRFSEERGLFVEEMISDYYVEEKDLVRSVVWKEHEGEFGIGEEFLPAIDLDTYRQVLHLSDIHPVRGIFPITLDNKDFFQSKISHPIDFTKYEYYLSVTE